jgi:hypothetical protein
MTEALFRSAHEALTFAFRFAHDQSPRTPMTTLLQGGRIGSGKGLVGVDGAGQAGMVLSALKHLNDEQRNVIMVRYGDLRRECSCCGQMAPTPDWRIAVDALSHCDELRGLPRAIRHAAIEKIVCRRRDIRMQRYASEYDLSARTLRHRVSECKGRLAKVENSAVAWLDEHFVGRELLVAA